MPFESFEFQQVGIEIGGGALIGAVIGFATKKIAKVIAVLVGLQLALFKLLETRGVLVVNWDAIHGAAEDSTAVATNAQPPGWLESMLAALPVSAGFAGGFFLGFRRG